MKTDWGTETCTSSSLYCWIWVTTIRIIYTLVYEFPFPLRFLCKPCSSVGGMHLRESPWHPFNLIGSNKLVRVQRLCHFKQVEQGMANCSTELPFSPLIKITLDDICRYRPLRSKYLHLLRWNPFLLTMNFVFCVKMFASMPVHKNGWMVALICLPSHLKLFIETQQFYLRIRLLEN